MKKLIIIIMMFVSQFGFSQITDDSLRSYTNTYIITNAARAITGAMLNTIMIDVIDSKVNVDSATTIRYNADTLFLTYWGCQEDTIILQVVGGYATVELDNLSNVAINTALLPADQNTIALGSGAKSWADLFLGTGSTINWYGDVAHITLTHSGGATTPILTLSHGLTLESGLQMNATDISTTGYVGRDSDNKLSWDGNDTLKIKIAGTERGIVSISTGVADNDKLVTQGYVNDADDGKANVELDGLSNVAINTALLPATTNTIALGSGTKSWSNGYLGSGGILTWHGDAGSTTLIHSGGALTPILTLNRQLVLESGLQMNATNILTTGYVGRDSDNILDWSIDNNLKFKINSTETDIGGISKGVSDNDSLVTKGYVDDYADDAVSAKAYWDRTGNYLYPKTIGDSVGVGTATPGAKLDVAGHIWQTGTGNSVFLGKAAGLNDDLTDNFNVFIGDSAGYANTTGEKNVFIGNESGKANTTGVQSVAIGYQSSIATTTGSQNSLLGYLSFYSNISGRRNTAIGHSSLYSNITGNYNAASGYESLYNNTDGEHNTANGYQSLYSNSTGEYNTGVGSFALTYNSTGHCNVAMGDRAGKYILGGSNHTHSDSSIFIGFDTRPNANSETNQIVIGHKAIGNGSNTATIGDDNVTDIYMSEDEGATVRCGGLRLAGSTIITSVQTGSMSNDTMVTKGYVDDLVPSAVESGTADGEILFWDTDAWKHSETSELIFDDANKRVGIGTATPGAELEVAGHIWQTGTGQSVFLGESAGLNDDLSDNRNVFVGYEAGKVNTTGYQNSIIGFQSFYTNISGHGCVANGWRTLYSNTTGCNNIANGERALYFNTTGGNNTANGNYALRYNTIGSFNTANGNSSLFSNPVGNYNTASGSHSLYHDTIGNKNVGIGANAGKHISGGGDLDTINNSVFVGYGTQAALDNDTNEIVIGYNAIGNGSYTGTIGDDNVTDIYLGENGQVCLHASTLGTSGQILNGSDSLIDADAVYNYVAGNGGYWDKTGNYVYPRTIGDNVGIGTATPGAKLDVAGHIWQTGTGNSVFLGENAGVNDDLSDNNNVFIGYESGKANTTGTHNIANGYQSFFSNTVGNGNTANGMQSLYSNTTGYHNIANGLRSLYFNTTGYYNTANGVQSLYFNTTGAHNTANGYRSLYSNTTGNDNTANGYQSLYSNTTGNDNTANGYQSLYSNTTGYRNTANGNYSLYSNTTGVCKRL